MNAMMSPPRFLRGLCLCACMFGSVAAATLTWAKDPQADSDWLLADEIVAAIQLPNIPQREFPISNFGAEPGADVRPAILSAIDAAVATGGGRVLIPEGVWLSHGPVVLQSRIELHLAEGAVLRFSPDPADYLPVVKTRWEGTELYSYSPLVYANNVEDVAITGKGTIDGNVDSVFKQWHPKQGPDMQRLRTMGASGVPVAERVFGEGTYLRPPLIQLFGAKRVLLADFTAIHSPFWVNHLVYTDHATVRGIRVDSHFPNNDGVDIESSSNVLLENSWFRTGDDSVVVKSGRDQDGREIGIPSQRIVVRNNDMGGEDGIALGSEMSGGIRDVFFSDNVLRKGISAFRFKANLDRGGLVENVRLRNLTVEAFDNLFWFQLNYPGELGGFFPSTYQDIVFENIQAQKVGTFLEVHAPDAAPLKDVVFRGIHVSEVETPMVIENAVNLRFEAVKIAEQRIDGVLSWRK
ncbi:glycoside hydrolase family 28 protein [Microbulbifer sp. CAU 1566]|uniref:glycoside hydrolase family 28 protein n=1 Tax=Microbulbifer sp. CAU 1566 TaxID=2933269 RepID=UPI0020065C77|nr:glycoside hydrolase family 28 protein [Microbulbifer sp. CAU 1566]MCK7598956.1 glycoside hydrolase family 28 protein [Microbulbifer sp. CAU 1566]